MLYAVIMAGGTGTRFWPLSRKNMPKQCLSLFSDKPMIQETVERLEPIFDKKNIYIASGKNMKIHSSQFIERDNFIIEPCAKNTTGCIGLACIELLNKDPEAIIFIETADHIYKDVKAYHRTIKKGFALAKEGKIVTIGIEPSYPATGYGYIKVGEEFKTGFEVENFREKPNKALAESFLNEGGYYWNSGMYIFQAKKMLQELERYHPKIYSALQKLNDKDDSEFRNMPSIPIDIAVSERSQDLIVLPTKMSWEDIGTWDSLEHGLPKDEEGNIVKGDYVSVDSKNNIIFSNKLVTTIGIKNLIVVQTQDATLICRKDKAEDVKKIVNKLKDLGKENYL
jgi:mannose-1-phosphate guanylyltransferase